MNSRRTAVYTTIYPQAMPFVPAWRESVVAQTDDAFDLCVGIDGLPLAAVEEVLKPLRPRTWIEARPGENGTLVRLRAMQHLVATYDSIVFVDSDDVLLPSRLAAARSGLEDHDVVGSALSVVDGAGASVGMTFTLDQPEPDDWVEFLARYNVFGLSNTAYRSAVLARCLPFERDCALTDWFLITLAAAGGARLGFDSEPRMLYRQHGNNTARVLPPFSPEGILAASGKVVRHYDLVLAAREKLTVHARTAVLAAQRRAREFHSVMEGSRVALDRYADELNRMTPRTVWWWAIANPRLEHLWKS